MTDDGATPSPAWAAGLGERYPGWTFGEFWSQASSGPGLTFYRAQRPGLLLTAYSAEGLTEQLDRLADAS